MKLHEHLAELEVIKNDHYGLSSDIWTESSNNGSYLQTHIQWIDNFTLRNTVLEMEYFPERHTSPNIKEKLHAIVEKLGSVPNLTSIVTDCGANMIKGVNEMRGHPCACHRLSTSIEKAWNSCLKTNSYLSSLNNAVSQLITAVNHKTNVQQFLAKKIQNSSQTRAWRGLYNRFHQIMINYDKLVELSRSDRALLAVISIDYSALSILVKFLLITKESFDKFEMEKVPTLNLVAPLYYKMQHDFEKFGLECDQRLERDFAIDILVDDLKIHFSKSLKEVFFPVLSDMHLASTILTPQYRKFNFIAEKNERNIMLNKAKSLIESCMPIDSTPDCCATPPHTKRSTYGEDSDQSEEDLSEFDSYLNTKFTKNDNTLEFWKAHASAYPALVNVAMRFLSKPAASSLSEKCFSIAGKINRPDRAHFKPKNLPLIVKYAYARKFFS